jgi:GntR family transcriptional regulator of arabinose operon
MNELKTYKYLQLIQFIKSEIESGKLKKGDRIYTESELCENFNISRQTVRQAISLLTEEGLLESRQGSGTYVVKTLAPRQSHSSVGVISSNMDEYIFPSQVNGIEHILSKNGYSLQLMLTHDKLELEAKTLQSFIDKGIAGLLFESSKSGLPSLNLHYYQELQRLHVPMIMINANNTQLDIPYIGLDDRKGGHMAAEHLVSMGHTSIAGIFKLDDYQGHLRYSGFMDMMVESELLHNENNVLWYSTETFGSLFNGIQDAYVVESLKDCTAVFCYNDQVACFLVQLLRRNGIDVPNDVSIIGYDDSNLATINVPNLTTIKHPGYNLGVLAAKQLLQLIQDPDFEAGHLFDPVLVQRDSIKKIKVT